LNSTVFASRLLTGSYEHREAVVPIVGDPNVSQSIDRDAVGAVHSGSRETRFWRQSPEHCSVAIEKFSDCGHGILGVVSYPYVSVAVACEVFRLGQAAAMKRHPGQRLHAMVDFIKRGDSAASSVSDLGPAIVAETPY
jgi:hypothetical protein